MKHFKQFLHVALLAQMICVSALLLLVSCAPNEEQKEESNLYRILVGEKYGFMDKHGKIIIEPQYEYANDRFSENLCYVKVGDKKYLIDKNGDIKVEIADSISRVYSFVGGLAEFTSSRSHGVMNSNGELIISAQYASLNKDGDDLYIRVSEEGGSYMVDTSGKIIGEKYDDVRGFCHGFCAIRKNDKCGYIDTQGKLVIDTLYYDATDFFENDLALVLPQIPPKDDAIRGKEIEIEAIGRNGNQRAVYIVDEFLSKPSYNRAGAIINGEKYLIDLSGNKICTLDCDDIKKFGKDHLATIIKNGKASKIDTLGNVVLKTQFDYIGEFQNNVAFAKNNGKWGAIDLSGKVVVNFTYESWEVNEENSILIFSNHVYGYTCYSYYDYDGNLIWQDFPQKKVSCPSWKLNRKSFIEYYDANITKLDPIEGIYYVTDKYYYQSRDNLNEIGLNSSKSQFLAVAKENPDKDEFSAFWIDGSNMHWVNKFVKLGSSNNYGIVKYDKDSKYSSEGRVTIEDFNSFDFRLEQNHNNYYNFFVTYEFVRDYPAVAEYELYQRADWTGTGFAIADGVIATNYHVTNGAKTIRVKGINGDIEKAYKGFVMASDKEHDLAVIKIVDAEFESFGTIPYKVGRATVDTGDDIFVLGYPMTSSMGNEVKLTDGIISSSTGFKGDESMYQISAAVQPGNSGGPVFDSEGNVIGIVCGKHTDAENANYAIKVSYLFSLLDASNCNVKVADKNNLNTSKLSSQVKKIKEFVYLIECRSK